MDLFYHLTTWVNNRKKPKLDRDYILQEQGELLIVKITRGKFSNILYRYDKVSIEETGLLPRLKFHYTLIYPNKFSAEHLTNSSEFVTIMGDILSDIVLSNGKNNEVRTHHNQEPDPE